MPRNVYFSQGTKSEQNLYEDITIEGLKIYGHEAYYIPRKIVNEDSVFNEDQLSEFGSAYAIEAYVANVDGYEGEGDLLSKFGLEIKDQVTLVIANRRWEQLIGRHIKDDSNLDRKVTRRPMEGDLIYLPFSKGLFEISFVEAEDPFYQLQNLPTFQLKCELFQYAGEEIDTGIDDIDTYETQFSTSTQVLTLENYIGVSGNDSLAINQAADGFESVPKPGDPVEQTIDGVKTTGEVKEVLETAIYSLAINEGSSQSRHAIYDPDTNSFATSTPGGSELINKDNHSSDSLSAGSVEGTWSHIFINNSGVVTMTNSDLGTGELPSSGGFTIHKTPTKISVYGIESSDGTNNGFQPTLPSEYLKFLQYPGRSGYAFAGNGQSISFLDDSTTTGLAQMERQDPDSDNSEFEDIGNNFIDFSISNPFGIPNA